MQQMHTNRELFLMHQAQTSAFPMGIEISSGDGVHLIDKAGKKYIDLISGISVSSLGHGNDAVKKAICTQAESFMHVMVYGEFIQSPQVKLATELASHLPASLNCAYFVNSGAEATEGALKLARRSTGRKEIIAFRQSYHGSTFGALSLNSEEYFTKPFSPLLPGVKFIEFNNITDLEQISNETACVIVETVRGEAGYQTASPGFLKALRDACTGSGALLILDEIQCGFGRTGSLFAFEQEGIIPDILLLGKALGAGMPMGAFIASRELMQNFTHDPFLGHITTFGGHPVICAAALAGLSELLRMNLISLVKFKEELIRKRFVHPAIKSVTGRGLMLALDFGSFELNKKIIDACVEDGVITDWFLFAPHKLRIAPPLIISPQQIDEACDVIMRNVERLS